MLLINKLSMSSSQEGGKKQLCEKYRNPSVVFVPNQNKSEFVHVMYFFV